ncbi:MAG: tRNA (adenosine(37)-N6)-threonylcarbamoyltransferase complex transferase subunit TsaD [Patescibacteria group bacterium]|nr:tRNA (adenosine(37)-N6)-threonylcarbamoyltransferase complex transferase subunit TsaD [Patescibacteria group bacterium]
MNILSIETSCDETAFAIGAVQNGHFKLLANTVSSQVKVHQKFGGVVPNLSAREHLKNFKPLLDKTLTQAGIPLKEIDCFSVAPGPGLIPALLVGTSIAKTLAFYHQKPLVPIHHLEGHTYATWLKKNGELRDDIAFPALVLIVSGGHTQLMLMQDHLHYEILGRTLDDAVGEAFDKVARILELGYPGGPLIEKIAQKGNPEKFQLPRPMINSDNLDFSFSGLKTAVLYVVKEYLEKKEMVPTADMAASFEQAVVDTLIAKTQKAVNTYNPQSLILAGGVAANTKIREAFIEIAQKRNKAKEYSNYYPLQAYVPELKFCGDNAAMQLPAVFFRLEKYGKKKYREGWRDVEAEANWGLSS